MTPHAQTYPADPDRACPHEDFAATVEVNRISKTDGGPIVGYSADINISCVQCGEPFRWQGVEAGLSPIRPTCSINATTLIAPLRPASSDPDFGIGLPGYTVRQVR